MLSDALFDAVDNIRFYLDEPVYQACYSAATWPRRAQLEAIVAEMKAIQEELDSSGTISAPRESGSA